MKNTFALTALSVLLITAPLFASADTLTRELSLGMRGSDVSALQTFLASDTTIYPQGLVTGYYGFLTKAAVSNFQSRNGISSVGRVGPATLPVLNLQIAQGMASYSTAAPTISSISTSAGTSAATVSWNTNEAAKGMVYYSTSPLMQTEHANSVDVSGYSASSDSNYHTSQQVSLPNLQANTTYYYLIYTTDQQGNVSVTWPTTFTTAN